MPLAGFSIQEEDALRQVECDDVPPLMVVAGPNGVGKSTLFEHINQQLNGRGRNADIQTEGDTEPVYFSPHRAPSTTDLSATLLMSLSRTSYRSQLGTRNYNIQSTEAPNYLRGGNQRSRHSADFAPYFEVKKRLAQFEFDKGNVLSEIYDRRGEVPEGHLPDINEPLKSAIDAVLPGIEYKGVRQENDEYQVLFEDRLGNQIQFDYLSSGEKDAIAMLFLLVERRTEELLATVRGDEPPEEDLVLLIDSPEAYLHPAMQERFLDFISQIVAESNQPDSDIHLQVLMCTHSQMILENVDTEYLYFLLYRDQRPDNQLVSAEEISTDAIETVAGELGISSLSAGKPLVLVEGKTDRELLRKLYPEHRDDLEIVPMGGKGKIKGFNEAFNELVPELYSSGIYLFGIVDRDRDISVEDSYEDFVYQLPVTCLENFLIKPNAMYDALETLAGEMRLSRQGISDPEDMNDFLIETIESDSFRQSEIKTRLNERLSFYIRTQDIDVLSEGAIESQIDQVVDLKKERIAQDLSEVRERIRGITQDANFDRLNGKLILSEVAGQLGTDKDTLARTVADNLVREGRKPERLTEIVEDIEQTIDDHPYPENLL